MDGLYAIHLDLAGDTSDLAFGTPSQVVTMPVEITLVRHAETEANASGIWQGHGDHPLSAIGRSQAAALGRRLHDRPFDLVIASDLPRAIETAALAGRDARPDPAWREIDIGVWEGLSRAEVHERFPEEIAGVRAGRPVRMGGGESWADLSRRIEAAFAEMVAEAADGARILIVTHGGVIHSVVASQLGLARGSSSWPIDRVRNTGITEMAVDQGRFKLVSFNDARHIGDDLDQGVALVRHAESEANASGRWHGITDGPLTERGRMQAADLGQHHRGVTRIYSSPLERARATAEAFASIRGLPVETLVELIEVDFGSWEGLTPHEIAEHHPEDWAAIFDGGEDRPRGGTGDTFSAVGDRLAGVIDRIERLHPNERVALFSHGGAIWSLIARVLGLDWSSWRSLAMPANTSVSHVRTDAGRHVLVDYNV